MSSSTRLTFTLHTFVALLFGLPLLLAPGRWLELFNWLPIDPVMSRLFGAAMLGLAWSSFRGWRAKEWDQVAILVELEAVFTVLAVAGMLRHILSGSWPWYIWMIFITFILFAIAWIAALIRK